MPTKWKKEFATLLADEALSDYDRKVITNMKEGYDDRGSAYLTSGRRHYINSIKVRMEERRELMTLAASRGPTEMSNRLQAVNKLIPESTWAKGYIESLISQEPRGHALTSPQLQYLRKIEEEHSIEALEESRAFSVRFDNNTDNIKTKYGRAMEYYQANPPYFNHQVKSFANGIAPTLKVYNRVMDNKFLKKVLEGYESSPKFSDGAIVQPRENAPTHIRLSTFARGAVVINSTQTITSACKGNKSYLVLPFGAIEAITVEERHMKHLKV